MARPIKKGADEVITAIRSLSHDIGMPPTVEELREYLGLGSVRTVLRYLSSLESAGLIRRWPGARGVVVTGDVFDLIGIGEAQTEKVPNTASWYRVASRRVKPFVSRAISAEGSIDLQALAVSAYLQGVTDMHIAHTRQGRGGGRRKGGSNKQP